jgi:16S rRNA pseudouridine516 synthase
MEKDTKPLKPAVWLADSANSGTMQLQEGRFHQIRRMFETIGNKVVALHRFKTGDLALAELKAGEYRALTEAEIASIFAAA